MKEHLHNPMEGASKVEPDLHVPNFKRRLRETVNPIPMALQDAADRTQQARDNLARKQREQRELETRMNRLPGLGD